MIRYQLALLGHSQRYLPPVLAFLLVMGVLYTDRGAPQIPQYAVSCGALTVIACWLAIALVDTEDPVQRLITLTHAGPVRLVGGVAASVLICCAGLTVVSLVWSAIVFRGFAPAALGVGALAHLTAALTGISVGLSCSRLIVPRIGYTVLVALAALMAVFLLRWLPLINPMLRAMSGTGPVLGTVLTGLACSLITAIIAVTVVTALLRRRA
ncbi:hypothetical protein FNH05_04070 [Amycolatopsis rhizosphaerae]|uniref:Integral membrane protein n=1 Tax=Amycolatopsis rhizosphaerae TaxID=2053003 RepID=A0A558DHS9_9PSEU|nr:hypothetical protein [Amycolatopsis rhizosphaerae]TVT60556.1 hypothetical protein FNH05_04070 [Amycolatopsis rhizosphaerae]